MRFSTLVLMVVGLFFAGFVATSSTAGDPKPTAVDAVQVAPVQTARIVRQRTVTVAETVDAQCGVDGCATRTPLRRMLVRSDRQRGGLMQRLFARRGSRSVSVVRGCCK